MLRRSSGSCRHDIGHSAAAHAQQRRSRRARRRPQSAAGAATVALADRLVAHHARCACSRPDSYLRRTRVESEGTKNTDRDDRLSVDRRGKGSRTAAAGGGRDTASDRTRPCACARLQAIGQTSNVAAQQRQLQARHRRGEAGKSPAAEGVRG